MWVPAFTDCSVAKILSWNKFQVDSSCAETLNNEQYTLYMIFLLSIVPFFWEAKLAGLYLGVIQTEVFKLRISVFNAMCT